MTTVQEMIEKVNEADRLRFEKWYSKTKAFGVEPVSLLKLRKGETYSEHALAITWEAWQAAILSMDD